MKKALILIDLEKEWIDGDSDYYLGDISKLIKRTNRLIQSCRKQDYKIIFTKHVEEESGNGFEKGTNNVEIINEIEKFDSDIVFEKNRISPFYKTSLQEELKSVGEIVVCGILTNLCVRSLVQDAYDRDFKITIIKDCCRAFDKETHDFTLKDLKNTREEINIIELKEFLEK